MKEVLLLRHAKSSWAYSVADRNRPLLEKGIKRIQAMATKRPEVFSSVDVFYASPANRALHTACLAMYTCKIPFEKLQVVETLYTFESVTLLHFLRTLPNDLSSVCLVGHNPALSVLVAKLSQNLIQHLPTAAWVKLIFAQDQWEFIEKGSATWGLPKELLGDKE